MGAPDQLQQQGRQPGNQMPGGAPQEPMMRPNSPPVPIRGGNGTPPFTPPPQEPMQHPNSPLMPSNPPSLVTGGGGGIGMGKLDQMLQGLKGFTGQGLMGGGATGPSKY